MMASSDVQLRLGGIPSQYEDGFAKLSQLNDEQARELSAAFRKGPPTMDLSEMTAALVREINTIPRDDIADIVFAVLPLSTLQADVDTFPSDVAEAVSHAAESSDSEKLKLAVKNRKRFEEILTDLLNAPGITPR
jgi:hypothetical protein